MPPKKSKTRASTSRGRSKSVGRIPSDKSSRPRSRSRQRSKERVPKRSRTPVSESKAIRRRRSSSSDRSTGPTSSGDASKQKTSHPTRAGATPYLRPLVRKIEIEKSTIETSERFGLKKTIAPSETLISSSSSRTCPFIVSNPALTIVSAILISLVAPLTIWLNLLITNPSKPAASTEASKTTPKSAYDFLGANWPLDYHAYLNIYSALLVWGYLLTHFVIARFIPFGRTTTLSSQQKKYRCNGCVALVVFGGLFALAQWSTWSISKGFKPSILLPKYWLTLVVASCLIAKFLAIWIYFASKKVIRTTRQSLEKRSSFVSDFFFGRVTRPNWFNLDWKTCLWRPGWFAVVLIDTAYLCQQFEAYGRLSPSLVLLASMHFILLLDGMIFGNIHKQSFGYLTVLENVVEMPFLITLITVYLSTKPDAGRWTKSVLLWNCSPCVVCTTSVLFLLGYWIYRTSKNQKDLFHREPHHPSLSSLEIIAGPASQRLLVGSWWGCVRHPDLVGEILMGAAITLTAGFESFIPFIYPLIRLIAIFVRAVHIEETAAKEYGPAWSKYVGMVRSRLIPKVF